MCGVFAAVGGEVLLGYCAYKGLAHTRLVKIPVDWFYSKQ